MAPVFDGATGAIGDPVPAAAPAPDPAPDPGPDPTPAPEGLAVPVAAGAVPVANPVDPAIAEELRIA